MNPIESISSSPVSRRQLLRNGAIVVSMGAVVAACGSNRGGSDAPGRIGVAPPPATLAPVTPDDVTYLRTAQSVEHMLLAVHAAAAKDGQMSAEEMALCQRLVADHTAYAEQLGALVTAAGGESFDCANPFLMDRVVSRVLETIAESDDAHRDYLLAVQAFESMAGASYQTLIPLLQEGEYRTAFAVIGGGSQRHAAVLARHINPDQTFSPTFSGSPVEKDADGFWIPYAIPSVFGRINGIDLVLGAVNDEGGRFGIQLQTPAPNSYIYNDATC